MMRKWQEVYGTAPPIANDPAYEAAPIGVRLAFPQSWEDPDYEWPVGERRSGCQSWLHHLRAMRGSCLVASLQVLSPTPCLQFTSYRVGVRR